MLYPNNIEEKLGFDLVRKWLKELCHSDSGRDQVDKIRFTPSYSLIVKLIGQAMELKSVLSLGDFPYPKSIDSVGFLKNCRQEGSYLEIEEILDICTALESALRIQEFLENDDESTSQLNSLLQFLTFNPEIPFKIRSVFDDKGEIRDDASPELRRIRKELKNAHSNLHRSLNKVFNESKKKGIVPENLTPTIRDGRLVIPVFAEYKRQLTGFIHDESSTGQTVYIEPSEALEANNAIIELNYAERREIIKILTGLSALLRSDMQAILSAFRFLALIDSIQAKARLAIELDAVQPELVEDASLHLMQARHPVLLRTFSNTEREVVPLDINLDSGSRILLVSGPNAGGKSVCLKTTGLIQYMIQSGIPVPLHPDSRLGIYKHMFVDIGDEQSIENDLSTYSSHLRNMNTILENADDNTLILIDEFGTGTDPQFGGAIAEAILESLAEKKCQGVITTHYGNLKEFAQNHEGVVNGAMQFDMDNLEPLYSLETGRPGSSFALEVASKIGLGKSVLDRARELIGSDMIGMESLLNKLAHEKNLISKKLAETMQMETELSGKIRKYDELKLEIDSKKREIIEKARNEASTILDQTNREIEKTIRHIKENKAQKEETLKVRSQLEDFKKKVKPSKKKKKLEEVTFAKGPVGVGDFVIIEDSGVVGEVIELKGKHASISVGGLTIKTSLTNIKKVKMEKNIIEKKRSGVKGIDIALKQSNFSPKLDIRGKRAEEVTPILNAYIDDVLLLGHQEVKILHGKGDGVLKQMVRDYFRQFPEVISVQDEHVERGGAGVTVVTLKS